MSKAEELIERILAIVGPGFFTDKGREELGRMCQHLIARGLEFDVTPYVGYYVTRTGDKAELKETFTAAVRQLGVNHDSPYLLMYATPDGHLAHTPPTYDNYYAESLRVVSEPWMAIFQEVDVARRNLNTYANVSYTRAEKVKGMANAARRLASVLDLLMEHLPYDD